ncbi:MAG: hypothetical protein ACK43M_14560 [Allorhizobium sp.]
MKNRMMDLNNHLFAQLERLSDEDLKGDDLTKEIERANAIVAVSSQLVDVADITIKGAKLIADHGAYVGKYLPMIDARPTLDAKAEPTADGDGK